jgi:uncharacterized protein (TIGR00288 family)
MKVMLLIDADNVSVEVIESAVAQLLQEHGALHGRRAYCNAESALKHQALFKRLGIRPMVNLAAGKNSTDIALAVDAIELVMRERPDVVALASSDSDFAPLVTRLREKGCRVVGFGQQGKTGDATVALYDQYTQFTSKGEPPEAAPKKRAPAKKAAAKAVAPKPAPKPTAKAAPKPPAAPKKRSVKDKVAAVVADLIGAAPLQQRPEEVQRILQAASELADHKPHELNLVAQHLREAGILGKNQSSTKLLRKHAEHFELLPESQPNKVRLRG